MRAAAIWLVVLCVGFTALALIVVHAVHARDACERVGGVWLSHEWVCLRSDATIDPSEEP